MFKYEIHLFEQRIETNFQCMTFDVISAYSVVARKIKCFYFVSAFFEKVSFRIKDETLRSQYHLTSGNVALWTLAVTLQSDKFYSSSPT